MYTKFILQESLEIRISMAQKPALTLKKSLMASRMCYILIKYMTIIDVMCIQNYYIKLMIYHKYSF